MRDIFADKRLMLINSLILITKLAKSNRESNFSRKFARG